MCSNMPLLVTKITFKELPDVVYTAFNADEKIYDFYDPSVKVSSVEEIVSDIVRKLKEYAKVVLFSVKNKQEVIGYFVSNGGSHLISFGVAVKYRVDKYLKDFFQAIKKVLGDNFSALLWIKNTRGVRWLLKNNMVVVFLNNSIIQLKCQ